jgi:hypothetical protein
VSVDRVLISLAKLRTLDLETPSSAGRPAHLSAASGLVRVGRWLYVVADDELHLGVFSAESAAPGRLMRVFPGELPLPPAERKASKPDFEAITLLPASAEYPHGALLALGSGSKAQRRKGVVLGLSSQGETTSAARECDFSGILGALQGPNIEGAFVCGDEMCLLQRANQGKRMNAILRYRLAPFLEAIRSGASLEPLGIHPIDLGAIDGVVLGLTDGAALPDGRFVFSAVAEDTADSYLDGRCVGAALGIATREGRVDSLDPLDALHKIEGVEANVEGGRVRLLLVTDADDAAIPASLYSAEIPLAEKSAG